MHKVFIKATLGVGALVLIPEVGKQYIDKTPLYKRHLKKAKQEL